MDKAMATCLFGKVIPCTEDDKAGWFHPALFA
jgi:hypothetical protein